MIQRRPIFPDVIEVNHQLRQRIGCNVYIVFSQDEWLLVDIGFEDTVDEIVQLIRQLDFPLSKCKTIVATHADADHIQGLAKAKQLLKTTATSHPTAVDQARLPTSQVATGRASKPCSHPGTKEAQSS